jgi:hypothetical protein
MIYSNRYLKKVFIENAIKNALITEFSFRLIILNINLFCSNIKKQY